MLQILGFSPRTEFKEIIDEECKDIKGFNSAFFHHIDEFNNMLEILPSIDVLVVEAPEFEKDYETLAGILNSRSERFHKVFIVARTEKFVLKSAFYDPKDQVTFITELKKYLNAEEGVEEKYLGIPINYLFHFKVLPFSLYINIGDGKYVKRIPSYEDIDRELLDKLLSRGVELLYFKVRYRQSFSGLLINNMLNRIEEKYEKKFDRTKSTCEVFKTTRDLLIRFGLKPRLLLVCESIIGSMMEDVKSQHGALSDYLLRLKTEENMFFNYRFILVTCSVASHIILGRKHEQMDTDMEKIVYASFFSDMTLKDPEHIHLRGSDESLDPETQAEVEKHAYRSAWLIEKQRGIPIGVTSLVKQHHGSVHGFGFPEVVDEDLSELALCLFAAQEISYFFLKNEGTPLWKILSVLRKKHARSRLIQYLDRFEVFCMYQFEEKKTA